ncbi:Mg chelatase, subunit ChlI [Pseudomonas putida LS46]|nr:Mg chelatase, subunit ChlI [Pseudomonas putida LS46]
MLRLPWQHWLFFAQPQEAAFSSNNGVFMSLALVHSRAQVGVQAPAVSVETHLANGLPHLTLVGLPETTVKESKDRVRSAIVNSGLKYPQRRITQNLAPADLPKDGGRYDLAIALGILAADGQVPIATLVDMECLGELALSGKLRPVQGLGGPSRSNVRYGAIDGMAITCIAL